MCVCLRQQNNNNIITDNIRIKSENNLHYKRKKEKIRLFSECVNVKHSYQESTEYFLHGHAQSFAFVPQKNVFGLH